MADQSAVRAGKAVVELDGDDKKLRAATQRGQKYLDDLGKASQNVNQQSSRGFLENLALQAKDARRERRASGESALERALGSSGNLTQFAAQSLGIGLPVMIAESLGRGLKESTDKMIELRKQFREGKIDEAEMARGLASGLPVIGDWVAGFVNLRDMITGEREALERVREETKRGTEEWNARVKAAEKYREVLTAIKLATEKAIGEAAVIGRDEFSQERERIAQERRALEAKKSERMVNPYVATAQYDRESADVVKKVEEDLAAAKARAKDARSPKEEHDAKVDIDNTKARLDSTKAGIRARREELRQADLDQMKADEKLLDARDRMVTQKYAEAWEKAGHEASVALDRAMTSGAAQRLRNRGEEYEAEKAQLDASLKEQFTAIERNFTDQVKRFGLEGQAGNPMWQMLWAQMAGQMVAAGGEHDAKGEAAANKEYERKLHQATELRQLQNEAIKDRQDRETAEMNTKYQAEVDAAEHAGRKTFEIQQRWDQAKANLEERHRQERADRDREEALRLRELELQGVQNRHDQELALIDAKYQAEIDKARTHPGERSEEDIKKQWGQERDNKVLEQAREQADAIHEMDVQIEQERTALQKRGLEERLAQLKIERAEALRREADPRTTTGVGADRINQLYDLKADRARMAGESAAGSFSARELARMGSNTGIDLIAKATRETADNTRRMADNGGPTFGA